MSKKSYKDIMTDWQGLLAAVEADASEIPNAEVYAGQLGQALADLQEMRARRSALQSQARELTQLLQGRLARGKDLAIRLRSWARGWFGAHNEKLTEFGVQPIRKRSPRRKPAAARDEAPRNPTSTAR